jgi:hypothetical protein
MVKSIVAIGGGQMTSRKDAQFSTTVIDQAIIELSGKKSPKLFFFQLRLMIVRITSH